MALSVELISQFVKATKDTETKKTETIVYGTAKDQNGTMFVQFDGASLMTPVITTADTKDGDRVTVMIKNHTAIITGNMTSPSARTEDVQNVAGDVLGAVDSVKQLSGEVDTELKAINIALANQINQTTAQGKLLTQHGSYLTSLDLRADDQEATVKDIKEVVDMIVAVAEEHDMDVAAIMNNIMTVIKGLDDRFTTQYQNLAGYVQDEDNELHTHILGEVGEYVDAIHIRINDSLDRINSLETRVFKLENT